MYVNTDRKLIFLAHPHTASRSIRNTLIEDCGFVQVGAHHEGPNPLKFEISTLPAYRKFYVVRNHWDTMASWWWTAVGQSERAPSMSITAQWLRHWWKGNHNYFQLPHLFWFRRDFPMGATLRFESLEGDLRAFLGAYGLTPKLGWEGKNQWRKEEPFIERFTPEAADLVEETFAEEILELCYSRHPQFST